MLRIVRRRYLVVIWIIRNQFTGFPSPYTLDTKTFARGSLSISLLLGLTNASPLTPSSDSLAICLSFHSSRTRAMLARERQIAHASSFRFRAHDNDEHRVEMISYNRDIY